MIEDRCQEWFPLHLGLAVSEGLLNPASIACFVLGLQASRIRRATWSATRRAFSNICFCKLADDVSEAASTHNGWTASLLLGAAGYAFQCFSFSKGPSTKIEGT